MPQRSSQPKPRPQSSWLGSQLPLETETVWYVFVSALDVFMTYILIRQPGFTEGNPIPAYFLNRWGVRGMVYFKFAMVAFVVMICQIIARRRLDIASRVLKFATLVVGTVVVYSLFLYLRHG